jgi:hypothetical protein
MAVERVMVRKLEMVMEMRDALFIDEDGLDLKPERVQEWLRAWPDWSVGKTGKTLHRTRVLPTADAAAQYGAYVTSLAGALSLPVRVSVVDGKVGLVLFSGRTESRFRPLTQAVLDFAATLG